MRFSKVSGLALLSVFLVGLVPSQIPVMAQASMYCVGNQKVIQGVSPALDGMPCLRGTPPRSTPQQNYRLSSTLCDNFCLWNPEVLIGQDF
jgi:hypothetical protein